MANEGLNYWANYDGVYWKELYNTNQIDGTGAQTISGTTQTYSAPTNMREAGGLIKIKNSLGVTVRTYPILEPQEAQFRDDKAQYAFFTGNPATGFTLNLNPAPDTSINGYDIDYVYYKNPTQYTIGASTSEIANPYFLVHRMLASRFRSSRNPYYTSAKSDAENAMRVMQIDNNSGSWADPWRLADNSGSVFGV